MLKKMCIVFSLFFATVAPVLAQDPGGDEHIQYPDVVYTPDVYGNPYWKFYGFVEPTMDPSTASNYSVKIECYQANGSSWNRTTSVQTTGAFPNYNNVFGILVNASQGAAVGLGYGDVAGFSLWYFDWVTFELIQSSGTVWMTIEP